MSVPVRCELVSRKNLLGWRWTVVARSLQNKNVEVADIARGRDFAMYRTTSGVLLQCGAMPQSISYEKLRLRRGKLRHRAHPVGCQLKHLTMAEREVQVGHVCDLTCRPLELVFPDRIRVQQLACGATHCVALVSVDTAGGIEFELFSWGLGEYGQLGLGECQSAPLMTEIAVPRDLHLIMQASESSRYPVVLRCGVFSTYVFARGSTELWHWGLLPSDGLDDPFVYQGIPVRFPLLCENASLKDVSVGIEHVVILLEDGSVLTWGHGKSGQLGLGPTMVSNVTCEKPRHIDFFHQGANHSIVAISCGWNHSIAVSKEGRVYAWGSNAYGACGASSKFCEYFQPVGVPVPQDLKFPSSGVYTAIRCGGNMSCLRYQCNSGDCCLVDRVFAWGMCSPSVGTLLPLEISSFRDNGVWFADFGVEWGNLTWNCGDRAVNKATLPGWIVEKISIHSESQQRFNNGMPYLYTAVGTHIRIRVQAMTTVVADMLAALPDGDINSSMFQATVQSNLVEHANCKNPSFAISSVKKVLRTAVTGGGACYAVDIEFLAQLEGQGIVILSSSVGGVIGSKFVIEIAPQAESDTQQLSSNCGEGQHVSTHILGVHVEASNADSEPLVEPNWCKLHTKRIRVHTFDKVTLLIESSRTAPDPIIQVESRNDQWLFKLTHHDVINVDSNLLGRTLRVFQLQLLSPGFYLVYTTKGREENEDEFRTPLMTVHCCMTSQERDIILMADRAFEWSKYQSALTVATPSAQFSFFLSSILQKSVIRNAVAFSPWAASYDTEFGEPTFDFDREQSAQQILMKNRENLFVLWEQYFATAYTAGLGHVKHPAKTESSTRLSTSVRLHSIFPAWANANAAKLSYQITSWLDKARAGSKQLLVDGVESAEVYSKEAAAAVGVSFKQIPFDFLGSVSFIHHRSVQKALAPANTNILGVHDSIVAWRRGNGDLFYSVQSNELQVMRYGHESHDFPETAQSGRITGLKAALSDFLWQAIDGKKVEDIFLLLVAPTQENLQSPSDTTSICDENIDASIRLRQLIFHTKSLGFDEAEEISKQEWFALFRGIQAMGPSSSTGITFSTFRLFLVDPFHQFFWKQYVHQVRERYTSSRDTITRALLSSFEMNERMENNSFDSNADLDNNADVGGDSPSMTSWSVFMTSLEKFHTALRLRPLAPSDCCRLLYRFDTCGNGLISTRNYQNAVLNSLDAIDIVTKVYDFEKSRRTNSKDKQLLKVAIANDHRRPNVESFTSSEAVHKLYAARGKNSSEVALAFEPDITPNTIASRASNAAATALRVSANTRLAQIRNLPISHLLREGIYFRPPRKSKNQYEEEMSVTQAQAMGAEDSY